MSEKTIRLLTNAGLKAILERVSHPGHKTLDDLRGIGRLDPDWQFLLKRWHFRLKRFMGREDADKVNDAYRHAVLELLRNCLRLGIPLSQDTLDEMAGELERLWWPPDPKAKKRSHRLAKTAMLRAELGLRENIYRWWGTKRPRSTAKKDIARHFGYASGEALRKDLQANRVNRRPRRKPRGAEQPADEISLDHRFPT